MNIDITPNTPARITAGWDLYHLTTKQSRPPQTFRDGCKVTIVYAYETIALCKVGESTYLVSRQFLEVEKRR